MQIGGEVDGGSHLDIMVAWCRVVNFMNGGKRQELTLDPTRTLTAPGQRRRKIRCAGAGGKLAGVQLGWQLANASGSANATGSKCKSDATGSGLRPDKT